MPRKRVIAMLLCVCFLIVLSGCGVQTGGEKMLSVQIGGQSIPVKKIDPSTDRLIGRKPDQDTDFAMEKEIFRSLMQKVKTFAYGDTIEIYFRSPADHVRLYDHLLKEDGTSYYNRFIIEHELIPNGETAMFEIERHIAMMLSSQSDFLAEGALRGFRVVWDIDGQTEEYAFVIGVK